MIDLRPLAFRLKHPQARELALQAVHDAPDNWIVQIRPDKRSLEQNSMMHALFDAVAKSGYQWGGRAWGADAWKAILVSGFCQAKRSEHRGRNAQTPDEMLDCPLIEGLEGELVQVRLSTAAMPKEMGSEFISYVLAWCDHNQIPTGEAGW